MAKKYTWYTYRDFDRTGKRLTRRTRGRFVGWRGTNLLGARMACFATSSRRLYIPRYNLTPETLAAIAFAPTGKDGE